MSCAPSVKSSRRSVAVWRGGRQGSRSSGLGCVGRPLASTCFQAASGCPRRTLACQANPAGRRTTGLPNDRVHGIRIAYSRRAAAVEVGSGHRRLDISYFRSICCVQNFRQNVVTRTSGCGLGEESWQNSFKFGTILIRAVRRPLRQALVPSLPRGLRRRKFPLKTTGRCAALWCT